MEINQRCQNDETSRQSGRNKQIKWVFAALKHLICHVGPRAPAEIKCNISIPVIRKQSG